jgi:hypothetical protein
MEELEYTAVIPGSKRKINGRSRISKDLRGMWRMKAGL